MGEIVVIKQKKTKIDLKNNKNNNSIHSTNFISIMDPSCITITSFKKNKKYSIDELNYENFWSKKEPAHYVIKLNLSKNLIYFEAVDLTYNCSWLHKVNYIRRIIILRKIYKNILDQHRTMYIPELQNIILNYVGWHNIYLEKQRDYYVRWIGMDCVQRYNNNKLRE